ncbi:cobalamin biosynthesis protein [Streptomyces katsurahamanus]|uniref:CobE/GbiG C-terminal domain-containing protein n=1 Tax=Streptomyces katsurahamanus TaxID=2577098 RepID=A0ABW9NQP9_9ACTN|nr:cobalamin biosynthesis protein [Streptomyces katsurahamanus]MQS35615.1 hypothetical protein [Streptomyces katsurahamanus]
MAEPDDAAAVARPITRPARTGTARAAARPDREPESAPAPAPEPEPESEPEPDAGLMIVRSAGDRSSCALLLSSPLGNTVLPVTDRVTGPAGYPGVLRPASLVIGVGAATGCPAAEIAELVREALRDAGLSPLSVRELATVEAKAAEPGIVAAAAGLGVPLVAHPAGRLAGIAVPSPSGAALAAVGTPSVAEAAALAGGGELLVPKRKSAPVGRRARATCAVVRRAAPGRIMVFTPGDGDGARVGDGARPGVARGAEGEPVRQYGLGRPAPSRGLPGPGPWTVETLAGTPAGRTVTVTMTAGETGAHQGGAVPGAYDGGPPQVDHSPDAPTGNGHVSIGLADPGTPWETVESRLRAAADADAVITLHRPDARDSRPDRVRWPARALRVLAEYRSYRTPLGIVWNASRPNDSSRVTTLSGVDPSALDMMTVVTVGNTATRAIASRMVTPYGYRWQA